jgi:hypothetical protein
LQWHYPAQENCPAPSLQFQSKSSPRRLPADSRLHPQQKPLPRSPPWELEHYLEQYLELYLELYPEL